MNRAANGDLDHVLFGIVVTDGGLSRDRGSGFGGIAALLGMLNSCATGLTVVNIDNGFGAAVAASAINRIANGLR